LGASRRPREVAAAGEELLLGGGLTRVVRLTNRIIVLGNRFAQRAMVAAASKRLLQPLDLRTAAH
jgi:hypothetical protein